MNHRRQRFLCCIQEATTEKTSSRLIVDCCALHSARRIVHRVRSQVHTVSHNAGCASNAAVSAARVARSWAAQRTTCFQFRHVLIIHFENFPGIMCLESNVTETFFNGHQHGCASNAAVRTTRVTRSRAAQRTKCFLFRHVLIIHFENFSGIMCLESNFTETFFNCH